MGSFLVLYLITVVNPTFAQTREPGPNTASLPLSKAGLAQPARWSPGPRLQTDPYDFEKRRLLKERPSLFGPISTIAVGGGLAVGTLVILGSAYLLGVFLGGTGDDSTRSHDQFNLRPLYIVPPIGTVVAIAGGLWLRSTIRRRRVYNQRIQELGASQGQAVLRW